MSDLIRSMLGRLRGVLGLATVAGIAGLGFGAMWTIAMLHVEFGFFPDFTNGFFLRDVLLPKVLDWGLRGALVGGGFGVSLAVLESRTAFERLTVRRMGLYGAAVGIGLSQAILLYRALFTPLVYLDAALATLPVAGLFGVLGATLSSSLLTVARRAHHRELTSGVEADALLAAE
ncbi:MAG: hypothetical protein AAF389_13375 [Gemmatimonadota bacterium]